MESAHPVADRADVFRRDMMASAATCVFFGSGRKSGLPRRDHLRSRRSFDLRGTL